MRKSNSKYFILSFTFIISSLFLLQCEIDNVYKATAIEYHINRSIDALNAWDINLSAFTADNRNMEDGFAYNPPNWLAITDDTCLGVGVPDYLKASCPINQSVIGLCSIRYGLSGGNLIIDTTIIISKEYQESETVLDEYKQSVYTHEVGHCLGLRHSPHWSPPGEGEYLMYPYIGNATEPHLDELSAIFSVYKYSSPNTVEPEGSVNGRKHSEFFIQTDTNDPIRHSALPSFYVYPYDPTHLDLMLSKSITNQQQQGKKLSGKPNTVHFYYYKNNDTLEEHIDGNGNKLMSKYTKAHIN